MLKRFILVLSLLFVMVAANAQSPKLYWDMMQRERFQSMEPLQFIAGGPSASFRLSENTSSRIEKYELVHFLYVPEVAIQVFQLHID